MSSGYVGIDPSSTATGIAMVGPRGGVRYTSSWIRPKEGDIYDWMWNYYAWVDREMKHLSIKASDVSIEQLSVTQNMDTVRKIAHFEALAILACLHNHVKITAVKATSARKLVYGAGNLSKREVYERNVEKHGKKLFTNHGKAALDVSDALGLAEHARLSAKQ